MRHQVLAGLPLEAGEEAIAGGGCHVLATMTGARTALAETPAQRYWGVIKGA